MRKFTLGFFTVVIVASLVGSFTLWGQNRKVEKEIKEIQAQTQQNIDNCNSISALIQSVYASEVNTSSLAAVLNSLVQSGNLNLVQFSPLAFDPADSTYKEITTNVTSLDACSYYEELATLCRATFTYTSLGKAVKTIRELRAPVSTISINKTEKSIQMTIVLMPKSIGTITFLEEPSADSIEEQSEQNRSNNRIDLGGE